MTIELKVKMKRMKGTPKQYKRKLVYLRTVKGLEHYIYGRSFYVKKGNVWYKSKF